ncbi:MAG: hypothetical protein CR974_00325 [Gammaproteobacteria bacterium]|nr:MAG: hypothetical protein CR974_00325 [Gammaproteobacteria bacterium]
MDEILLIFNPFSSAFSSSTPAIWEQISVVGRILRSAGQLVKQNCSTGCYVLFDFRLKRIQQRRAVGFASHTHHATN